MKLKRLEIQNFMGIGEGVIDFNRGSGLTLIKGINNDSPTSDSNGAAKSSIFEALYWVLKDKTKRGITGDAVINTVAKKNCKVTLLFDDYTLVRSRKPNELRLYKGSTELTKGTIKETQTLLDDITKTNEFTFSKLAYFGQEDIKPFASLTDSELKKVFEQALGLVYLTEYHAKTKAHLENIGGKLAMERQQVAQFEIEIKEAKDKITILQKAVKDLKERRDAEQLRILADIGKDEAALETIKQQYIQTRAQATQAEESITELSKKLYEYNELQRQLNVKYTQQLQEYTKTNHAVDQSANHLLSMKDNLENADKLVGQSCETCKRPFTETDIANVAASLKDTLVHKIDEHKQLTARAAELKGQVDEIAAVMEKLVEAIGSQRDQVTSKKAIADPSLIRAELQKQEATANDHIRRIEDNKTVLCKLANEDADYAKEILNHQNVVDDRQMEKSMIEKEIIKLQEEYDTAEMLVEIFGPAGLKSYVFDNITPALNEEIGKYARILDDIDIEISTVTRLKNGELREKFNIKVENKHGADGYKGNSGGEKQKVNLAIALGFNKVFREMSEGAVNAVFLDEPFESLDTGSSEAVIELCKAFTGVDNVFVITHQNSIKDLISDVITVEKTGKVAKIS